MRARVCKPKQARRRTGAGCSWLALLALHGCTIEAGERFGRPVTDPQHVRIGIPDGPTTLDPARARTEVDAVLARALFRGLVELDADGRPQPSLALRWDLVAGGRTLRLWLDPAATFTDGSPLAAHDVVWSWQRALRTATQAQHRDAFAIMPGGAALVAGELLRVRGDVALGGTPFSVFDEHATATRGDAGARLAPGASVRVLDTNARRPCCGIEVSLLTNPRTLDQAVGTLAPGAVGRVLAARVVDGASWLRIRGADGLVGWVPAESLARVVPPVSMRRVVEQGAGSLALLVGPDLEAPTRETLEDDDAVEVLERGPELSLVVSARSGRAGFIRSAVLGDALGEHWWLKVEDLSPHPDGGSVAPPSGWVPGDMLVFDPGVLAARAVDAQTLDVDLAEGVDADDALRAMAEPVMRPVPPRLAEELGFAWAEPAHLVTSGAFTLVAQDALRITLSRASPQIPGGRDASGAHDPAPRQLTLVVERDPVAALRRVRGADVDALLDGMLPRDLVPTLRRFSDFVPAPGGGAFVASELAGFNAQRLDAHNLRTRSPP